MHMGGHGNLTFHWQGLQLELWLKQQQVTGQDAQVEVDPASPLVLEGECYVHLEIKLNHVLGEACIHGYPLLPFASKSRRGPQ
jgi:DMSO/TMAO reductase YedYZ molybdopterin-dependent catalytic subunit